LANDRRLYIFIHDHWDFTESQIALAGLLNLLFLLSIGFMIIGTYFVRTSKPCRMCGEQVHRSDPTCRYCGYGFKDSASAQGK